jgi:hypothetical protein
MGTPLGVTKLVALDELTQQTNIEFVDLVHFLPFPTLFLRATPRAWEAAFAITATLPLLW